MSTGTIIWSIVGILFVCCLFIHRRVVKALVRHEQMPKAPKWHFWVPAKGRRS